MVHGERKTYRFAICRTSFHEIRSHERGDWGMAWGLPFLTSSDSQLEYPLARVSANEVVKKT